MFNCDKMLINCVDMNTKLTRATDPIYILAPSNDNKVRIKILDASFFLTQVEMKPLFFLLTLMYWE